MRHVILKIDSAMTTKILMQNLLSCRYEFLTYGGLKPLVHLQETTYASFHPLKVPAEKFENGDIYDFGERLHGHDYVVNLY